MEIHLTPEQEEQLAQIATKARTDAEGLVKDAALRLLEQDARFRAAVREGLRRPTGGVHRRRRNGRPPKADVALIKCASAAHFSDCVWVPRTCEPALNGLTLKYDP
jgi:hypothetical protein